MLKLWFYPVKGKMRNEAGNITQDFLRIQHLGQGQGSFGKGLFGSGILFWEASIFGNELQELLITIYIFMSFLIYTCKL